jgi:ribonuclease BN (tRNA processing enzyme)
MIGRNPVHTKKIIEHHATPSQVGSIFVESKPRLGAFYHIVGGPGAEEEISQAIKKVYDGDFLIPDDLTAIEIGDEIKISKVPS